MKKFSFWMLAAMISCSVSTTMLTSCTEMIDTPVTPTTAPDLSELEKQISGWQVDISDYVMGDDAVSLWHMNDDRTFEQYYIYTDEEGESQIEERTGRWEPFMENDDPWDPDEVQQVMGFDAVFDSEFEGIAQEDLTERYYGIDFSDSDTEGEEDEEMYFVCENAMDALYAYYQDTEDEDAAPTRGNTRAAQGAATPIQSLNAWAGSLSDSADELKKKGQQTKPSEEELKALGVTIIRNLNSAGSPQVDTYNINSQYFTRENWRNCEAIYLYDGKGKDYIDANGKDGYIVVELPWNKKASESNIPLNFCNNITPDHGWELVLNYCGSRSYPDRNVFALYNRYTGILRFFTFIPKDFSVADANDHAWQVTVTEEIAKHLHMKFALPMETEIEDKKALGQTGANYSMLSTPWVENYSSDGHVTPRAGWWTFDVDLSLYRPSSRFLDQSIKLDMCAWSENQVSLNSTIKAKLEGTTQYGATSGNTLTGVLAQSKDLKDPVMALINSFSFDAVDLLGFGKSVFAIGKTGYSIYKGLKGLNTPYEPENNVRMNFDGTVDTEGIIRGSRTVTGVTSTRYDFSEFDLEHSTVGQGVWNLRKNPVVYLTTLWYEFGRTRSEGWTWVKEHKDMNHGQVCFFDPSSIDVVLNPNVLPKDQIEYMKVTAVCGARTSNKSDAYDSYRTAFGLGKNAIPDNWKTDWFETDLDSPVFDYFYGVDNKEDLKMVMKDDVDQFTDEKNDKKHTTYYALLGRGEDDYLIEPQMMQRNNSMTSLDTGPIKLPAYEVNVTIAIKLKGIEEPLFFSRTYLPEIKGIDFRGDLNAKAKQLDNYLAAQQAGLQKGHTQTLEFQVAHLKQLFKAIQHNYETQSDFYLYADPWAGRYNKKNSKQNHQRIFDRDIWTKWCASYENKSDGGWWTNFRSSKPIRPVTYTMTTGDDTGTYPKRNPREWYVYAKVNNKWVQIDHRNADRNSGDALPAESHARKTYTIQDPGTGLYTEFRLLITSHFGGDSWWDVYMKGNEGLMQLAEFEFGL